MAEWLDFDRVVSVGDDARTKSFRGQVTTPFPSGCSHGKKERGTIREEVVAVACTWDVAPGLGLKRWGEGVGVVIHCK